MSPHLQAANGGHTGARVQAAIGAVALACILALGLGASSAPAQGLPTGAPMLHPCTVESYVGRCATFMVREDRLSGTGPQIPIRVFVVPASGPDRQPDPIVWFEGGPGTSGVDVVNEQMPFFAQNTDRDVVFVDQRGTGASALSCKAFPSLANKPALRAAVQSCVQGLKGNLRYYTTAMFADDLNQVLSELHYGKVNVVGDSYGVTSAQVFLLRHPERVRTMTLLSGTLLDVPILERFPENAQRAMDEVFAECNTEPSCHAAFPHLSADWASMWASVLKAPWVIPAKLSPNGKQMVFGADSVAAALHTLLIDAATQTEIPLLVHLLGASNDRVATILAIVKATPPAQSNGSSDEEMLQFSTMCNEPWAVDDPTKLVGKNSFEYQSDLANALWWQYVCQFIPKPGPAAGSEQLTSSSVPVLAFNGEEDPQNPPANMAGAKAFWPNSLELAVPYDAHYIDYQVGGPGLCEASLTESFIEHGTAAHLDTSCLSQIPSPTFALTLHGLENS